MIERHRQAVRIGVLHALKQRPRRREGHGLLVVWPQEQGAHHRGGGQRQHQRHHDRQRKCHGELAEQPPDQAAHQQDRQEHGDQRRGDRNDGEADLARAAQRGLHRRHAVLEMAGDVFQDYDGIVDDESGGNGQRHQRQVVERIAHQIHRSERADDGDRHGDSGDDRGTAVAQEHVDHGNHQQHGDDQRALGIAQ